MSNPSRLEELKASGSLPSPKGAALQVLTLCKKDDVTNQEVAHAIQADAALSARLIKLANSPVSHQVRPIVSVVDAVTVLGLNTVRQIVLGLSLVDSSRNLHCKNFDYEYYWSHSLLRSIAIQNLIAAGFAGLMPAEEMFVLGLLSNVGVLALATAYPDEYSQILQKHVKEQEASLVELEHNAFGFDHRLLSQEMLADWRMPKAFQEVVLYFESPTSTPFAEGSRNWTLVHLLHVADYFAKLCLAEPAKRSKMMTKLVFKAARVGVESSVLAGFGDKAVHDWHEWSRMFRLRVMDVPGLSEMIDMAPLVPEPSDADQLPTTTANQFKLRILLVDDERSVLMIMKMLLDSAGHTVELARNGIEALEKVKTFNPQLIITDWIMPEMDGVEFCRQLRRNPEWRKIYVFILTALESTDRLVEAFEAGVDDFMTKPINTKILGARLNAGQRMVQLQEELEHEREQLQKFAVELAESNKRFQKLALTDELTGLPNRRFANEHLERQWAAVERSHGQLACMILDIDYFKSVNDRYGHKFGDDALKQVAKILQLSVRKQDVVCRLGGEEFLIICPDILPEMLGRYAERLRVQVEGLVMNDPSGKPFKLTISVGAASRMPSIPNAETLLQIADKRLYAAKEKGRNCIVVG